ncbi:unnamed protein product, partial [Mesorhabditis belari]|uniref:Uncharacterized protein n=1 Tax=Mesorhabditis belari TaxID=2138241 RepID=A0AAF3ENI6_9BILA
MNVQVFHLLSQSFLFLVLLLYYRIDNAEGRVFLGYQPPPQPPLLSSNVVQRSEDPDVYGPKIRSLHQTRSHFHPPAPQPEFETTKKLPFKKKFLIHVLLSMQNEQNNHSDHKILNMLHEKFREHAGPFIPHFLHREIRRDTLKFWGEKTKRENFKTTAGNPPIVRLDAVFGANDPQVDLSLEKAIEMEIDEALSNVLLSLDKDPQSPKMDVSLRKQLEESLIDEISKNLSETLEESEPAGITSEDLSKAIEEGFDELEKVPQTTSTRRAESSTSSAQIFETDSTLATSAPKRICTTQNDEKLNIQADVLLFIDSTSFLTRLEFAEAIEVFYDSLKNLRNVGSKGIQVSLIQLRHGEPYLEFSFQRHQCLDWLLEDIKDTTFLPSLSGKGGELEKIAQFAFTKSRGDRENAKNLMIVITAGQPDPSFLNDAKKLKENEIELVILATQKADPNQLITLTSFTSNIFVLRQRNNGDTSAKIARLIFEEASHKVNPSKGPTKSKPPGIQPPEIHTRVPSTTLESRGTTTTPLAITTVPAAISTPYFGYTAIERAQIKDENETLVLPSTISQETEPSDSVSQQSSEYADANILSTVNPLDQPNILQLQCLPHAFRLHFDLPLKFEGSVFIKGHENDNRCRQDILSAQPRPIEMYIDHDICGATRTHSHNISFITLEDRAFILQCSLNMKKAQSQTISADLMVITNEITIGQTISLQAVPPTCNYSIHKSNPGGELIKKAKLGDSVFHTWKCDAIKEINDDYGMLIHDCYVGSEYNNQIPLLDAEGCSTDGELISEIVYDQENLMAYGETKAFAFENGSSLQFTCSVTLCSKEENGCNGVTPPSCAKEVHPNEYSALHATRRDTEAIKPALTMKLQTKVGVTSSASLTLKDRISQIAWSPVAWLLGSFMIW